MKKNLLFLALLLLFIWACAPRTQVQLPNPNRLEVDTVMQRGVIRTD